MFNYMTNYDKVRDFNQKAGKPSGKGFYPHEVSGAFVLVKEEYKELLFEYDSLSYEMSREKVSKIKANLIKEAADLLYVTYGLFHTLGVNADDVFREVHYSNMSKLVNGRILKDEHGKVLKGPDYRKPNMEQFLS